jgi:hypothetical protein
VASWRRLATESSSARVISHGRYAIFQMAEVAVRRELFGRILAGIARLRRSALVLC